MGIFSIASALASGNAADMAAIISAFEGSLPVASFRSFQGTDYTIASTTVTTLGNPVAISTEADELLVLLGTINWSGSNVGDIANFYLYIDGSNAFSGAGATEHVHVSSTSGNRRSTTLFAYGINKAGSYNVSLRWSRSGSGTLYTEWHHILAMALKRRA